MMNNTEDNIIDEPTEEDIAEEIDEVLAEISKNKIPPYREHDVIHQKKYVLGFAMDYDKKKVLLIKKNRPIWQAGLLNGIGGKIEDFDLNVESAMQREFIEETGLDIPSQHWHRFAQLSNEHFHVSVFWAVSANLHNFISVTDEEVQLIDIEDLYINRFTECVSNLSWLISLLKDNDLEKIFCDIHYK